MIQDYKLATSESCRRRPPSGKRLTVVAAALLMATGITIRFVDLAEGHGQTLDTSSPVTQPLTLPTQASVGDVAGSVLDVTAEPPSPAPLPLALAEQPPAPSTSTGAQSAALTEDPDLPNMRRELNTPPEADALELVGQPATSGQAVEAATEETLITDSAADPAAEAEAPDWRWVEHRIAKGDTLAKTFAQVGLSPALLHRITHSSETAASLAHIRPGQLLRLQLDTDNELQQLVLQRDRVSALRIRVDDEGFAAEEERKDLDRHVAEATGTIESSLFADGQRAGLDDELIMELAAIFGWDIDFALELRAGDRFSVVYEELFLDGEKVRNGAILAAEFVNRGTTHRAVRYENSDGEVGYFDPDGHNKRRAFIRTPVKFARVSSGFTTRRWHPVLKTWRSHKGVDYAAPTGTPVKATGAGRVVFKGWKGGYGKVVFIEHAGKYTTVYGHLSRFSGKISDNARVKQGQVIGYVGKTGLATGPHLHYEFRVNGAHRNPLTVKLPKSLPLPQSQLADFHRRAAPLLAQLDELGSTTLVAGAELQAR